MCFFKWEPAGRYTCIHVHIYIYVVTAPMADHTPESLQPVSKISRVGASKIRLFVGTHKRTLENTKSKQINIKKTKIQETKPHKTTKKTKSPKLFGQSMQKFFLFLWYFVCLLCLVFGVQFVVSNVLLSVSRNGSDFRCTEEADSTDCTYIQISNTDYH